MIVEKIDYSPILLKNEWILPQEKLQTMSQIFKPPKDEITSPKILQNYYFSKLASVCQKACKNSGSEKVIEKKKKALETLKKVSQLIGEVRDFSGRSILEVMIIEKTTKEEFRSFMHLMGGENKIFRPTLASYHYEFAFHFAANVDRPELIEVLKGFVQWRTVPEDSLSPLHCAIIQGAHGFIKEFLKLPKVPLDRTCKLSHPKWDQMELELSPLALATALGEIQCLDTIVENSKDKECLCENVATVGNLLHLAIRCGQPLMLEHLLSRKHIEVTRCLIDDKAKGVRRDCFAPIHLASTQGDLEALLILYLAGADLNAQDNKGRTPLHYAVINEHEEAVKLLAHPYLKVNLKKDDEETRPPFFYAKEGSDISIFLKNAILEYEEREIEIEKKVKEIRQNLIEQNNKIKELEEDRKKLEDAPPIFSKAFPPQNLVLEGGGPQSIAFIGGLKVLEEKEILSEIKRIAGTSAGSMIATFLAIGYTIEEAKQLLMGTQLISLLDNNNNKGKRRTYNTLPHLLSKTTIFADNFIQFINRIRSLKPLGITELGTIAKMIGLTLWNSIDYAKIIVDHATILSDLNRNSGLCKGDALHKWIEKAIKDKANIDHFTFGELKAKVALGNQYKHLHIFATKMEGSPEVVHFNSEDSKWDNHVISYVTSASGALPIVFEMRTLKCKIDGRLEDDNQGPFCDGGIVYNCPIEVFDKKKYVMNQGKMKDGDCPAFNKKTLALSLYTPGETKANIPTTGFSLLGKVGNMMYNAERAIRNTVDYNSHRTIKVSNLNTSTFDFDIDQEKMEKLSHSEYQSVKNKLRDSNQDSFEILYKKIEETEGQLNESNLKSIESFFEQIDRESHEIMLNFGQDISNFFNREGELFDRLWKEVERKTVEKNKK